jgi:hypothetical protein
MAYVNDSSVYTAVTADWPSVEASLNASVVGEQGTEYGMFEDIEAISGAHAMLLTSAALNRYDVSCM